MPINNSSSETVVLSVEQQNSINLVERRLLKLREEISDAKTELKSLVTEVDKITEEKNYQSDLLVSLKKEVAEVEDKKKVLLEDCVKAKKYAENLAEKTSAVEKDLEQRSKVVREKEDKLLLSVEEHNKKVADFNKKFDQFEKDKEYVINAKTILAEAISKI